MNLFTFQWFKEIVILSIWIWGRELAKFSKEGIPQFALSIWYTLNYRSNHILWTQKSNGTSHKNTYQEPRLFIQWFIPHLKCNCIAFASIIEIAKARLIARLLTRFRVMLPLLEVIICCTCNNLKYIWIV